MQKPSLPSRKRLELHMPHYILQATLCNTKRNVESDSEEIVIRSFLRILLCKNKWFNTCCHFVHLICNFFRTDMNRNWRNRKRYFEKLDMYSCSLMKTMSFFDYGHPNVHSIAPNINHFCNAELTGFASWLSQFHTWNWIIYFSAYLLYC